MTRFSDKPFPDEISNLAFLKRFGKTPLLGDVPETPGSTIYTKLHPEVLVAHDPAQKNHPDRMRKRGLVENLREERVPYIHSVIVDGSWSIIPKTLPDGREAWELADMDGFYLPLREAVSSPAHPYIIIADNTDEEIVKTLSHESFHYLHNNQILTQKEVDTLRPFTNNWMRQYFIEDSYPGLVKKFGTDFTPHTHPYGGRVFAEAAAEAFADYATQRGWSGHTIPAFEHILDGSAGRRPQAQKIARNGIAKDLLFSLGPQVLSQTQKGPLHRPAGVLVFDGKTLVRATSAKEASAAPGSGKRTQRRQKKQSRGFGI